MFNRACEKKRLAVGTHATIPIVMTGKRRVLQEILYFFQGNSGIYFFTPPIPDERLPPEINIT